MCKFNDTCILKTLFFINKAQLEKLVVAEFMKFQSCSLVLRVKSHFKNAIKNKLIACGRLCVIVVGK